MTERLFRVYLHTDGDESVREYIVTATNEDEARARALRHVKSANLSKGERSQEESRVLTEVLAVAPTSKRHCLMIHSVPRGRSSSRLIFGACKMVSDPIVFSKTTSG